MRISLKLSGSLRLIYPDKDENIVVEVQEPITVRNLLYKVGISPFVTPFILIDGKKIENKDSIINEEVEITVIGPLAGG